MAFVVSRPNGSWELRISESTASGPRSRTLASFRELTGALAEQASLRSGGSLGPAEAVELVRQAGAPVATDAATAAATTLGAALARGEHPPSSLARVLCSTLNAERPASDAELAAARWLGTSLEERGQALVDLLDIADATGRARRAAPLGFPPLVGCAT